MIQLIVNDVQCDLPEKLVLAITFKAFDIATPALRYSNYTNRLKLPKTNNNKTIFGNADYINSAGRKQYVLNDVRLIIDSVEVINSGFLVIDSVSDMFEVTVFSGLFGFSTTIGDKILPDLTDANANAALMTTVTEQPLIEVGSADLDVFTPLPSSRYSDIIEAILSEAGYAYAGDVFTANDYIRMALVDGRDGNYNPGFGDEKNFKATKADQAGITESATYKNILFGTVESEGSLNWYDQAAGTWTLNTNAYDFNYTVEADFAADITGGAGGIDFSILKDGVSVASQVVATGAGVTRVGLIYTSTHTTPVTAPVFTVKHKINSGAGMTVAFKAGYFAGIVSNAWGSVPYAKRQNRFSLPDMKQIDLLKDFMIRFALIPVEKDNTITFKDIQSILDDKANAVNWTTKRVKQEDEITFSDKNYGQNNEFKYSEMEEGIFLNNHTATIDNVLLPLDKTFYESPFVNTRTELVEYTVGNLTNMARIPVVETGATDIISDSGFRLIMFRAKYLNESTSFANIGYFNEPREAYQMTWKYFYDTYYALFFASLQDIKRVSYRYNLSSNDIANFDPSLLVYDNGNYYCFPTIKNWIAGKSVVVEMLKV